MPRVKAGELSLSEIRNLVRQHNSLTHIDASGSRPALISAIQKSGYKINHQLKSIVKMKGKIGQSEKIGIKVGSEGQQKPQKRTLRRARRKAIMAGGRGEQAGDIFANLNNFLGGRPQGGDVI
mgnify:FL=1